VTSASLEAELKRNYAQFAKEVVADSSVVSTALLAEDAKFFASYRLLCAFRAFHEAVIDAESDDVQGFFIEAHNDLLTSHVHAMNGMWRSGFKSLRSYLENFLCFVYYKDHTIELELWKNGKFRIGASALFKYCDSHPKLGVSKTAKAALDQLKKDYERLSVAVHASRTDYRMTSAASYPQLSTSSKVSLGHWQSRELSAVRACVLVLFVLFSRNFTGAAHKGVRSVVGPVLTASSRSKLLAEHAVRT
jgi:hypothetical protein